MMAYSVLLTSNLYKKNIPGTVPETQQWEPSQRTSHHTPQRKKNAFAACNKRSSSKLKSKNQKWFMIVLIGLSWNSEIMLFRGNFHANGGGGSGHRFTQWHTRARVFVSFLVLRFVPGWRWSCSVKHAPQNKKYRAHSTKHDWLMNVCVKLRGD